MPSGQILLNQNTSNNWCLLLFFFFFLKLFFRPLDAQTQSFQGMEGCWRIRLELKMRLRKELHFIQQGENNDVQYIRGKMECLDGLWLE